MSLAAAQWGAINKPVLAFYLLRTRGWELLSGAFAAFHLGSDTRKAAPDQRVTQVGSLIEVSLVTYAVFAFDK
jgi:peptidoglycan/LPS O-acetylase OafA/YrhL